MCIIGKLATSCKIWNILHCWRGEQCGLCSETFSSFRKNKTSLRRLRRCDTEARTARAVLTPSPKLRRLFKSCILTTGRSSPFSTMIRSKVRVRSWHTSTSQRMSALRIVSDVKTVARERPLRAENQSPPESSRSRHPQCSFHLNPTRRPIADDPILPVDRGAAVITVGPARSVSVRVRSKQIADVEDRTTAGELDLLDAEKKVACVDAIVADPDVPGRKLSEDI